MAIEIKELYMNLHIGKPEKDASRVRASDANNSACETDDAKKSEVIVQNAVKEVLRILKQHTER